ncbi:unnamed protein product [Trichobilharzia regenti]|nr:unnamed protein product [Trichobilharzia regenti]
MVSHDENCFICHFILSDSAAHLHYRLGISFPASLGCDRLTPSISVGLSGVCRLELLHIGAEFYVENRQEWERAKAKAEEDRRRQLEEEQRIHNELKATQHRLSMAASLPPEPPAPKTPAADAFLATPHGSAGITTLRFRLPQGCTVTSTQTTPGTTAVVNHLTDDTSVKNGTIIRRFSGLDLLKHVFIFMESKGFSKSDYKLLTTYPTRDVSRRHYLKIFFMLYRVVLLFVCACAILLSD